jgi:hypothetical protein
MNLLPLEISALLTFISLPWIIPTWRSHELLMNKRHTYCRVLKFGLIIKRCEIWQCTMRNRFLALCLMAVTNMWDVNTLRYIFNIRGIHELLHTNLLAQKRLERIKIQFTHILSIFFPVALLSLKDLGRLTYRRFLELFRHMVWLLRRVIRPSEGLYLHRQHNIERRGQTSMTWAGFEPTIPATNRPRPTPQTARPLWPEAFHWYH